MTAGFYKLEDGATELLHAPAIVAGPTYTLIADTHAQYEYPVDGWYWFESREEAEVLLPEGAFRPPEPPVA